jgi:chromate transporter
VAGLSLAGLAPVLLLAAAGLVVVAVRQAGGPAWLSPAWLAGLPGLVLVAHAGRLPLLFWTFLVIGATSFGSGYVLFAYLQADFVQGLHWLSQGQLVDAIALGQVTPGPVFTTATFLGYLFGGVAGALLATLAIFLPGFALVPLVDRLVRLVGSRAPLRAFLDGVNLAVLGLIAAVTLRLGIASIHGVAAAAVAAAAFAVLLRWPLATPLLVAAGAALGLLSRGGF